MPTPCRLLDMQLISLKDSGNYMYHLLQHSAILDFANEIFMSSFRFLEQMTVHFFPLTELTSLSYNLDKLSVRQKPYF